MIGTNIRWLTGLSPAENLSVGFLTTNVRNVSVPCDSYNWQYRSIYTIFDHFSVLLCPFSRMDPLVLHSIPPVSTTLLDCFLSLSYVPVLKYAVVICESGLRPLKQDLNTLKFTALFPCYVEIIYIIMYSSSWCATWPGGQSWLLTVHHHKQTHFKD